MDWKPILEQVTEKLTTWGESFGAMLPNLVVAVLVMFAAWGVARLVSTGARRALRRTADNQALANLAVRLVYLAILAAGLMIALGVLRLEKTVTSMLAGVGIVGMALGFAFQDMASNFISGVFMAVRRPVRPGDIVATNDFLGTIERIDLRTTNLRTFTGETVYIPNKDIHGSPLVNYTDTRTRRVDVDCGIAYGDDLDEAEELVVEALEGLEGRDTTQDVSVVWNGFGSSSIDFTARVWIDTSEQPDFLQAKSAIIKRIKRAFDDAGVTIPFPIRTLDFGVVGGERLDELGPLNVVEARARRSDDDASDEDAASDAA